MKSRIGTIRSDKSGFSSLATISKEAKKIFLDTLELDFSACGFFEANMVAPFYTVLSHVYDNLNKVTVSNVSNDIKTILQKNHFLCIFGQSSMPDSNQTTIPFKKFKLNAGEQFSDYLGQYMKDRGIPKMSDALTKKFRQSLFEIFQNAAMHSESKSGIFVCGQFYPNKHRLNFTIADAGIGIRENVRRYLDNPKMSSCRAIRWALEEGHSTRISSQPGGLGLKLLKDFIELNKGAIQIVSRFGFYEFSASKDDLAKLDENFPGTCVNIEINTADTCSYCLNSELKKSDIF